MTRRAREEKENARDSIHWNDESNSIEIDGSNPQSLKQEEPRISIVRGITMDAREELKNACDPIVRTQCSTPVWTINRQS
jgi:hypothetical protein